MHPRIDKLLAIKDDRALVRLTFNECKHNINAEKLIQKTEEIKRNNTGFKQLQPNEPKEYITMRQKKCEECISNIDEIAARFDSLSLSVLTLFNEDKNRNQFELIYISSENFFNKINNADLSSVSQNWKVIKIRNFPNDITLYDLLTQIYKESKDISTLSASNDNDRKFIDGGGFESIADLYNDCGMLLIISGLPCNATIELLSLLV